MVDMRASGDRNCQMSASCTCSTCATTMLVEERHYDMYPCLDHHHQQCSKQSDAQTRSSSVEVSESLGNGATRSEYDGDSGRRSIECINNLKRLANCLLELKRISSNEIPSEVHTVEFPGFSGWYDNNEVRDGDDESSGI